VASFKHQSFERRRGISPETLLGLVRNTAPFIFETESPAADELLYLRRLRDYKGEGLEDDQAGYFLLCLCAHWATAGTFVPTDVDNAIRLKLWEIAAERPLDLRLQMADWTIRAARWDYRPVTAKLATAPSGAWVSTHEGTWFSVAVGAYASLRNDHPGKAREVLETILAEAEREDALWREILASGDGLMILRACALLAHNFGDLDRVVDMWRLPADDAVRRRLYDAAKPGSALFGGRLGYAGRLNQKFMAPENHRYFALREPKFLRRSREFLLPVAPFLDEWGARLAREKTDDLKEAVAALIYGSQRTPGSVAFSRALAGIVSAYPGGAGRVESLLTARDAKLMRTGVLRQQISVERPRFEAQWSRLWKQVPPPRG
jgi:hypothetical protein